MAQKNLDNVLTHCAFTSRMGGAWTGSSKCRLYDCLQNITPYKQTTIAKYNIFIIESLHVYNND